VKLKTLARAPLSLLLALVFLACGTASLRAQEPRHGGTLRVAVGSEPNTLDCHAGTTFTVVHHLAPHYSFLVKFDAANYPRIIGDLAESWTVSPDGLVYTFRLHDGVQFHDGSPLTSADVKASFDRISHPPQGISSPRADYFRDVTAIEAPDPRTVVFRLSQPNPSFMTYLANPYNCIYSAARLAQDQHFPERTVMGSGPYVFVERVPGATWTGRRFDHYFRAGLPYLDGFQNILMTNTAMLNALQGGQVHAEFRGVSPPERDRLLQANPRLTSYESPWLSAFLVSFNTSQAPFNDVRVRQALSLAIDRWGAVDALSRVSQLRFVGGLLRPGFELAASDAELQAMFGLGRDMAANRAQARRLLQEAGVTNLSFRLGNRPLAPYPAMGIYLVDQWRQIGVTVEQQMLETAPYFAQMTSGQFQAIVDFTTEYADEPNLQWIKFLSMDRAPPPLNSPRYTDRTLDQLFDQQSRMMDAAQRRVVLRQFESRMFEQAYYAPTFWFQRIVVTSSALKGFHITPSHLLNQDLAELWLAE
jgi:peptide/nickel transport system substrate-binding protein